MEGVNELIVIDPVVEVVNAVESGVPIVNVTVRDEERVNDPVWSDSALASRWCGPANHATIR